MWPRRQREPMVQNGSISSDGSISSGGLQPPKEIEPLHQQLGRLGSTGLERYWHLSGSCLGSALIQWCSVLAEGSPSSATKFSTDISPDIENHRSSASCLTLLSYMRSPLRTPGCPTWSPHALLVHYCNGMVRGSENEQSLFPRKNFYYGCS